ncbi:MAG: methylmalonyl-CoA epimerase [Thermotogae bacterium]|nr:methylmalonyl-CoA epimerase [Thermotogota bacterium]
MVKLSHIALAVPAEEYEEVKRNLRAILNVSPQEKELPHAKLKVALFKLANATVELLAPTGEGSDIDKFLEKRGKGIHHIALQVDSIADEVERLEREGFVFSVKDYEGAKGGKVAFLHPKSTGGFLFELVEEEY